jgi:hypothetical protein
VGALRQTAVKTGCLTLVMSPTTMVTTNRPFHVLKESK